MLKLLLGLITIATIACGRMSAGTDGLNGKDGVDGVTPTTTVPPVDDADFEIYKVVDDENDYRLGLGQSMISTGLSCNVQQVASGQWLSSSSPGYNAGQGVVSGGSNPTYSYLYKGLYAQPDSNVGASNLIPEALQPLYAGKNYVIRCSGFIVVLETDYYNFDLTSDDGSILTVDGTQVINNDGNHGMTKKTGTKFLRKGVRSFSLLYAQTGGGNFGLVLKAGGQAIDPKYYYH